MLKGILYLRCRLNNQEWTDIKDCKKLLFHIHQYYAIQQALKENDTPHEFK